MPAVPIVMAGVSVASSAIQGISARKQGKAQQKALDEQALAQEERGRIQQSLLNYNARHEEQAGEDAKFDARHLANMQRSEAQVALGRQRSLYAAAGVVVDSGSPLLMSAIHAGELELAALDTEMQGKRFAQQAYNQAARDRFEGVHVRHGSNLEARASRQEGRNAKSRGNMAAISHGLNAVGSAVGAFASMGGGGGGGGGGK